MAIEGCTAAQTINWACITIGQLLVSSMEKASPTLPSASRLEVVFRNSWRFRKSIVASLYYSRVKNQLIVPTPDSMQARYANLVTMPEQASVVPLIHVPLTVIPCCFFWLRENSINYYLHLRLRSNQSQTSIQICNVILHTTPSICLASISFRLRRSNTRWTVEERMQTVQRPAYISYWISDTYDIFPIIG